MTLRLTVCCLVVATSYGVAVAQPSGVLPALAGRGVAPAPDAVSVDVYPFIVAAGGVGGTVGYERERWHVGVAAFTVAPQDFIEQTFFRDTDSLSVTGNDAIEAFVRVYPRADRRWLYAEVIGGPEWFRVSDDASGASDSFVKVYVVPKLGVRVLPLGDLVSVDAAIGYAFNLSGTEDRTLGSVTYRAASGGPLPFLQLGTRIPLGR